MKVSAAVLVGCVALAASTADVVSGATAPHDHGKPGNKKLETTAAASDEIEGAVSSTGNHEAKKMKKKRAGHRALRGGDAEAAKAAKKHNAKKNQKKRSLKAEKGAPPPPPPPPANENRAYTYTTAAAANNNNKKQQQQQQAASNANAPYVNNKYDYLDRYSAYLTPKQLEQLRNNNPPAPPASNQNQETNVGGAESDDYDAVVVSAPSYSSSYTQTAAVQQPQRPVQQQRPAATTTTPYVSTLDLNRGEDANGPNLDSLNRNFEPEAPIAGYDAATGYGSTGNGGNANANGSGALDTTPSSSPARPYVQTTEWKPIDKSVWVEHYVPGVGNNPNTPPTGSTNSNIGFPNRNPGLTTGGGSANANRIPASSAPCNGANPNAAPTQSIQTIWDNTLWGTCSTTAGGCRPGSCCLIHPTFGRGACVSFDEICEPGQSASEGDCPYSWITSDKCACDSGSALLP